MHTKILISHSTFAFDQNHKNHYVIAMSLRVRTQEAEGHLCILSRELNQGLKMTSPASIPGSQVSEKAAAWGIGGV